jgi:uncharacterized membrane protein
MMTMIDFLTAAMWLHLFVSVIAIAVAIMRHFLEWRYVQFAYAYWCRKYQMQLFGGDFFIGLVVCLLPIVNVIFIFLLLEGTGKLRMATTRAIAFRNSGQH